jgi:hypothetical protein
MTFARPSWDVSIDDYRATRYSSANANTSEIARASETRWPARISESVRGCGARVVRRIRVVMKKPQSRS